MTEKILSKKILLIEGDGIGLEVICQAKKIIDFLSKNTDKKFETVSALLGGVAYDKTGTPLPKETIDLARACDAILLGAVGGPKWENLEYKKRPERGLLGIRKELELFANLRPVKVFNALAHSSTLKPEIILDLDIMIVRELTGDLYFGEPRGVRTLADGSRQGLNTMTYNSKEVARIAYIAFELAKKRSKKLCSVDKANVIETTEMWRQVVTEIGRKDYPEIELSHIYVDNAAMQLVRNPRQFDVMLTGNMFGDILSDTASMLTGSLGMLPSASLGINGKINGQIKTETKAEKSPPTNDSQLKNAGHFAPKEFAPKEFAPKEFAPKEFALYEPIHGSAPDIAGKNIANPIATILSLAMMLRYSFAYVKEANLIEKAVANVLNQGIRTADIAMAKEESVSCSEMADKIILELERELKNYL
jgi:3-isopropylmalate dehydrogenase